MSTATFTAKDVQELRQRTGAGMMDCKKALEENQGNMEASVDYLRKKGIAKAEKRAGKSTSEGIVRAEVAPDNATAVLVEVNCETDFVARNEDFQAIAKSVADQALATASATDAAGLLGSTMPAGQTVEEFVKEPSAKMGEAVNVRRVARFDAPQGVVGSYVHFNGKIGVLVQVEAANASKDEALVTLARTLAEHVAALAPVGVGACPACGGPPVSSTIVGWQGADGARHCPCALCATMWNVVRVKCTLCDSTKGITYMGVEGGTDTVKAETCDECWRYVKILQGQKDALVDAVADDVGSLGLDMLMQGTRYERGAYDPFLLGY